MVDTQKVPLQLPFLLRLEGWKANFYLPVLKLVSVGHFQTYAHRGVETPGSLLRLTQLKISARDADPPGALPDAVWLSRGELDERVFKTRE